MPVPPEKLDEIAATVAAVYREAEISLVRLLTKHLKGDLDSDLPAPEWVTKKLGAIRDLRKGAQAVIAGLNAASAGAFRDAAAEAFRSGAGAAVAELPKSWFPKSGIGQTAAQATFEQLPGYGAVEALAAAVHKDVGQRHENILRDVTDAYRNVITAAASRTLTGTQTRRQASQAAWRALTNKGITSFTDRSGRRWQLSSYVEMAARTVTQRAAVTGQTDRLAALDVDLVSVSNHGQECVKCRPFEGRVLSLSGQVGRRVVKHATKDGETVTIDIKATLQQARRDGFQHPNCRHSVSAYLPGVSKLPTGRTEDPEGDKARTRQRELEREIRAAKVAEVGALDEQAKKAAGVDVRAAQAKLRDHLKANPTLKRLPYREQIGAGNIPPKGGKDAAGSIGPTTQPTLDGGPGSAPKPRTAPDAPVVVNDPNQTSLLDVRPGRVPADPLGGQVLKPKPAPPPPKPGDKTLAELLDPKNDLTDASLIERLASGNGTSDERAEWAAAFVRFTKLADQGEADSAFAAGHGKYVAKLPAASKATVLANRRLGQLKTEPQKAATLRALWRELERRATNTTPGMQHGRRFRYNGEAVDWAMQEMPLPRFTPEERQAVVTYTGSSYSLINNGLRGWKKPEAHQLAHYQQLVRDIDGAFAKAAAPEPLLVHRGSGASVLASLGADINDPASIHALVGKVFVEKGYVSTSIGRKAAFGGQVFFAFRVPTGYQTINAMHISRFGTAEREILVRRDGRYVVHAAYQHDHAWYIEAEFVPDGWTPGPSWTPDPYGDIWEGYS